MNTDRTIETIVQAWLVDGFVAEPDPESMLRSVRASVAETPQRGKRWRSFGPVARPAVPERGLVPARGFTMFSAPKFVAAGVIVALFGGFLLSGILTTSQGDHIVPAATTETSSPTTSKHVDLSVTYQPTDDPAVFKVISEPHRRWLKPGTLGPIAVDPDGGVWVQGWAGKGGETLFVAQVGLAGRTRFGRFGEFYYWVDDLEFSRDGKLWGAGSRVRLRSLDGDTWTVHPLPPGITAGTEVPDEHARDEDYGVIDLTLAPDGVLYGLSTGEGLVRIVDGRVTGQALGLPPETGPQDALAVTPDGTVWVGGRDHGGMVFASTDHGWLVRLDGDSSERVRPLGDGIDPYVIDLAVGPKGALWGLMRTEDDSFLGRYDGEAWAILSTADGLPAVGAVHGHRERMDVGPDGRVWFSLFRIDEESEEPPTGDGLAVFDGQGFRRYLADTSVNDLAIAPDGSAWTSTDSGIYVIHPESKGDAT